MAKEISVTGQKKVGTLMREFNALYPYLGIRLYSAEAKTLPKGQPMTPYRIPTDKTLASVRTATAKGGDISLNGNKKIKTVEKEFETVFGLYAQVCYRPKGLEAGKGYITSGAADEYTLASFNEKCKADGTDIYEYGE